VEPLSTSLYRPDHYRQLGATVTGPAGPAGPGLPTPRQQQQYGVGSNYECLLVLLFVPDALYLLNTRSKLGQHVNEEYWIQRRFVLTLNFEPS